MRKLSLLLFFTFLSLLEIIGLSFPNDTLAQTPGNTSISCDDVDDPEFHSLRPYQKNTRCTTQTADQASFCGNNLIIKETITQTYPGSGGNCTTVGNKVNCTYNVPVSHPITIDLNNAELPIMGNTEDVSNSQSSDDALTDAEKVNEYVSWYLNGTINRAEYGDSRNTDYNIVNLSGPIQKLYPQTVLEAQRINTINNAKETRHNQIAVCATTGSKIGDFFNIGHFKATECYKGDGSEAQGEVFRLKAEPNPFLDNVPVVEKIFDLFDANAYGWDNEITWTRSITNLVPGGIRAISDLVLKAVPPTTIKYLTMDVIHNSISTAWNKAIPPLPWDDGSGRPFESDLLYRKAYNEWRGKTCIVVPVINYLACFDSFTIPNKYADLFAYVPLSSTEDVEGQIAIDSVSSATNKGLGGVTVNDVRFSGQAAELFFPHMIESDQLGSILQDTFTPKGGDKAGAPTDVSSTSCSAVEVRSNDGDDLFATQITGTLSYTASFSCTFDANSTGGSFASPVCNGIGGARCVGRDWACATSFGSVDCGTGYQCGLNCSPPENTNECKKDVYINLSTKMSAPLVDDIWSRLVAGPMSVFKRIFPKTNTEGSVGQIIDIPGSTNITYSGSGVSSADTDLKIPHIGGVSEYFLKGIQTALRPKGMGEPVSFGPNSGESGSSGEINCNQSVPEITLSGLNKEAADNVTKMWYEGVPGHPYFKECNNDVIQRAQSRGVDPIFTLAIWIHESDASNYEAKTPVEDFGIHGNSAVPANNFSKQLDFFLNLPNSYAATCGKRDIETFISMFWFGECTPANQEQRNKVRTYINDLNFIYSVIAPGIALPNYPN